MLRELLRCENVQCGHPVLQPSPVAARRALVAERDRASVYGHVPQPLRLPTADWARAGLGLLLGVPSVYLNGGEVVLQSQPPDPFLADGVVRVVPVQLLPDELRHL